jgi:ketosteroid isomerase-like protein
VSPDNVEIVRRAHELYRRGQFDAAIDRYFDPGVAWETRWPGLEPWFHGHDGVREWVRQVTQPMDITMELTDARALDSERVLAAYRLQGRGRGSDVPTDMKVFDVLWLRDGQIYRRRTFYSEEEALDATAGES